MKIIIIYKSKHVHLNVLLTTCVLLRQNIFLECYSDGIVPADYMFLQGSGEPVAPDLHRRLRAAVWRLHVPWWFRPPSQRSSALRDWHPRQARQDPSLVLTSGAALSASRHYLTPLEWSTDILKPPIKHCIDCLESRIH